MTSPTNVTNEEVANQVKNKKISYMTSPTNVKNDRGGQSD